MTNIAQYKISYDHGMSSVTIVDLSLMDFYRKKSFIFLSYNLRFSPKLLSKQCHVTRHCKTVFTRNQRSFSVNTITTKSFTFAFPVNI